MGSQWKPTSAPERGFPPRRGDGDVLLPLYYSSPLWQISGSDRGRGGPRPPPLSDVAVPLRGARVARPVEPDRENKSCEENAAQGPQIPGPGLSFFALPRRPETSSRRRRLRFAGVRSGLQLHSNGSSAPGVEPLPRGAGVGSRVLQLRRLYGSRGELRARVHDQVRPLDSRSADPPTPCGGLAAPFCPGPPRPPRVRQRKERGGGGSSSSWASGWTWE